MLCGVMVHVVVRVTLGEAHTDIGYQGKALGRYIATVGLQHGSSDVRLDRVCPEP